MSLAYSRESNSFPNISIVCKSFVGVIIVSFFADNLGLTRQVFISKATCLALLIGLLHCSIKARAVDLYVVTPGPTEGWNIMPFGPSGDVRYQQIYAASLFGGGGPVRITAISFSADHSGTYFANVAIRLNQTSAAVGALNTNLDANVTGSLTTVLDDPGFTLNVNGGDLTYQLRFDLVSTPFIYDPGSGQNLLMDIVISGNRDSWMFARGGVSNVTSRSFNGLSDNVGLRTKIDYTPVPECSTFSMAFIGLALSSLIIRPRFSTGTPGS